MNPRERPSDLELSQPVKLLSGALLLSFTLLAVTALLVWNAHRAYERNIQTETASAHTVVRSPGESTGWQRASDEALETIVEHPNVRSLPDDGAAGSNVVHGLGRDEIGDRSSAFRTLFAGIMVLGIFLMIAAVSSGLFTQLAGYLAARRRAIGAPCARDVGPAAYAPDCKFRVLVEQSVTGIFVLQDDRFVYVNPRFAEIFGYAPEEVLGTDGLTDLVMPDVNGDPLHFEDTAGGARRSAHPELGRAQYTVRRLRKDGSAVYADVFRSELEYDGRPALIGTVLDVTESREAQERLRVLGMAVEQSSEGVLVIDTAGIVCFVNPAWAKMHGYDVAEVTGRHFRIFHTEDQLRREVFPVINRFERTSVYRAEMGHLRKDGSTFVSSTAFAPLRDDDGTVIGAVGICRDITEEKTYEAELLAAKEAAEELSRLRTAFLTNMSHEIRTPLTGILGFARVLEDEVQEDQSEFVHLIRVSADRLLNTLNSILSMARLQAGAMSIQPEDVDLADEISDIAAVFHGMAREKHLDFRLSLPPAPLPARIDRTAFGIILNNLIGNAVKFTCDGGIVIQVTADHDDVEIVVTDTGVGIDDVFLPLLFDEFKQESDGLTRTHEGSGLGLAITKRLVDLLGGGIDVESTKGAGASFRVRLPRYIDEPALSDVA